jgi:hypothetical protein
VARAKPPDLVQSAFRRLDTGSLELWTSNALAERGVPHGFSLRWRRGAGGEPFGLPERDGESSRELAATLGLETSVLMRQVHGSVVKRVDAPPASPPVCDGLVTGREGIALTVRVADCVPLLFWDPVRRAAGAVHAGWRGTLSSVAPRAVERLEEEFGSRPEDLLVVAGAAIGPCCYEVGDEVVSAYRARFSYASELFASGPRGRAHLDLIAANRRQLLESGARPENVHALELCTSCANTKLYSFRREGRGVGRLLGAIGIKSR